MCLDTPQQNSPKLLSVARRLKNEIALGAVKEKELFRNGRPNLTARSLTRRAAGVFLRHQTFSFLGRRHQVAFPFDEVISSRSPRLPSAWHQRLIGSFASALELQEAFVVGMLGLLLGRSGSQLGAG